MELYRIAARQYAADLSGEGARLYGGRWNPPGFPVLYTAESVALAVLETLVNLPPDFLESGIFSRVTISLPDDLAIASLSPADLPPDWQGYPAPPFLAELGREWLVAAATVALAVPSVVVAGAGRNLLLNPRHPDFSRVEVADISPFRFDSRFFRPEA